MSNHDCIMICDTEGIDTKKVKAPLNQIKQLQKQKTHKTSSTNKAHGLIVLFTS